MLEKAQAAYVQARALVLAAARHPRVLELSMRGEHGGGFTCGVCGEWLGLARRVHAPLRLHPTCCTDGRRSQPGQGAGQEKEEAELRGMGEGGAAPRGPFFEFSAYYKQRWRPGYLTRQLG